MRCYFGSRRPRERGRSALHGRAGCAVHLWIFAALLSGKTLKAKTAPIRLVAKADTVLVYLNRTLPSGGFVVYRSSGNLPTSTPATRTKLTDQPVSRVREPSVAAGQLGQDVQMVMRATRAVDENEMLRRLNNDRFAGDVLTGLSRGVASVLGRLYVDAGVTRGTEYEYRVVITNRAGVETDTAYTARIRVVDVVPAAPTNVRARVGDSEARVTWSYPKYAGDPRDLVVGFHVYRGDGTTGGWRRLTLTPLARNDAATPDFVDVEARNGQTVRFQVTAVDMAGRESAPAGTAPTVVQDRTPPAMPEDIVVQEGEGIVSLSWRLAPEPDVAGYHVERAVGLGDKFTRLDRTMIPAQRPEWVDTVPGARRFYYRIIVVDAAGNASDPSNAISAVAHDKAAPNAPTNVTAAANGRRVTLKWSPVNARDLRGYFVYRGDTPEHLVRVVDAPIIGTQYVDSGYAKKGLRPGGNYFIEVSAVDSSFNESPHVRAQVSLVDDEAPTPPTTIEARNVLGRYVEVEWSASTALDVVAYEVSRSLFGSATDSTVRLGRLKQDGRALRDTTPVHARRYLYRVTPIDSAGNRGQSAVDTVEFRDFVPPPPPRVAAARLGTGGVTVTWQRVIASELAGYNVYRSTVPTGVFQKVNSTPVQLLTLVDRAGAANYFYMVRAVDRSGNESDKSPVVAVIKP